jgi:hypothetical protein
MSTPAKTAIPIRGVTASVPLITKGGLETYWRGEYVQNAALRSEYFVT